MKVLIVGGDTVALATNFVLSSFKGIDTTVVSPYRNPLAVPYLNGPRRQHGNSEALREALEYFELASSEYKMKFAALIDGKYSSLNHKLREKLDSIWSPAYLRNDTELFTSLSGGNLKSEGLSFDAHTFTRLMFDYAKPLHGELLQINYDDGDACFVSGSEYFCVDYDVIILTTPRWDWISASSEEWPVYTENKIVRVAHKPAVDFDILYVGDTSAIHRITYNEGLFVCESDKSFGSAEIMSDLEYVFGDPKIDSWEINHQPGILLHRGTEINRPNVFEVGPLATFDISMNLANSMEAAKRIGEEISK